MKSALLLLLLFGLVIVPQKTEATAQVPDTLIWNAETYPLFENPLEEYFCQKDEWPDVFDFGPSFTHCTRGYSATFEIKDSKLYLTKISKLLPKRKKWWERWKKDEEKFPCEWRELPITSVFPNAEGSVFAEWYSGSIIVPQGEQLEYVHVGYASIYEKEIHVEVEKGIVKKTETIDNSKKYPVKEEKESEQIK